MAPSSVWKNSERSVAGWRTSNWTLPQSICGRPEIVLPTAVSLLMNSEVRSQETEVMRENNAMTSTRKWQGNSQEDGYPAWCKSSCFCLLTPDSCLLTSDSGNSYVRRSEEHTSEL